MNSWTLMTHITPSTHTHTHIHTSHTHHHPQPPEFLEFFKHMGKKTEREKLTHFALWLPVMHQKTKCEWQSSEFHTRPLVLNKWPICLLNILIIIKVFIEHKSWPTKLSKFPSWSTYFFYLNSPHPVQQTHCCPLYNQLTAALYIINSLLPSI